MYGSRVARVVEAREEISLPRYNMTARKSVYMGGNDNNTRASRGKAIVDEGSRLGSSRAGDLRVTNFGGAAGKSRSIVEHANRDRADELGHYATMAERRGFRNDSSLWKLGPGADEAPLRAEGGGRFRDGLSSRGERVIRNAPYSDDGKLVRNGNYDDLGFDNGARTLRDVAYPAVTKNVSTNRETLPGLVFEYSRRSIEEFFSPSKANFILPIDDRRLEEQVGPTTKIFMFDRLARELHGVFQAEAYSYRPHQGASARVRVRVAKECLPLTERQFKGILHEILYDPMNFTNQLTKEQVMKLLQTFGQVDAARSVHASLPTSRRISDSGLSQSSQEFHSISDEIVYRKEERWRRGTVDTRSISGHSYHSQEAARFSSKPRAKSLDELADYEEDEGIMDLPVSTSRLTTGSSPYSSRGKQQSLRTLSGSRNLGVTEVNWREDVDPREVLYRKRQELSPSPIDEFKGELAASSPWKDLRPMVGEYDDEIYARQGKVDHKVVYKEESSLLPNRRRRHNEIDLNMPLEMGHGELIHLHDVKSKGVRRRVWVNDDEEKGYSVSPPKGSLLRGSCSMPTPDHLLSSEALDDYGDDSRLDSRHMVNANRKEYGGLRAEEAGRPVSNSFSNGKFVSPQSRNAMTKNNSKDKPVASPIIRKRPFPARDSYSKEATLRGAKANPVFKIKASLQTSERGRPGRVVTMVNERVVTMGNEGFGNGGSNSQGRKRKSSVWSRITLPRKGPGQKGAGPQGKGRVFSRLGPSVSSSFEQRDDTHGHKNKKPRSQHTEVAIKADSEMLDEDISNSPDALEGEDYLNDDHGAEESDKEMEKGSDDLQGWTRKKSSVLSSGDESRIRDHHGAFATAKGGRRKLVRPSIGAPTLDEADDAHAHLGSYSGSMDVDEMRAHGAGNKSPRGSRRDLNSLAKGYHPDFEEVNLISS